MNDQFRRLPIGVVQPGKMGQDFRRRQVDFRDALLILGLKIRSLEKVGDFSFVFHCELPPSFIKKE